MARGEHRQKNTHKLLITIEHADAALENGKVEEALACYRRNLAERKERLAEQPDDTVRKRDLVGVCGRFYVLANKFLWEGKFSMALAVLDEAIPLIPLDMPDGQIILIWAHLTQAHALLFTGDAARARMLYLRYCGRMIYHGKGKRKRTWEAVVLGQFDQLRARDHWHQMMEEIEQRFAEGPRYDGNLPASTDEVRSQLNHDVGDQERRSDLARGGSANRHDQSETFVEERPKACGQPHLVPTHQQHNSPTIPFKQNEPRPEPFYDADGKALYRATCPLSREHGQGGIRYLPRDAE